jgi:hypothetical protein
VVNTSTELNPEGSKDQPKIGLIVGLTIAGVAIAIAVVCIYIYIRPEQKLRKTNSFNPLLYEKAARRPSTLGLIGNDALQEPSVPASVPAISLGRRPISLENSDGNLRESRDTLQDYVVPAVSFGRRPSSLVNPDGTLRESRLVPPSNSATIDSGWKQSISGVSDPSY